MPNETGKVSRALLSKITFRELDLGQHQTEIPGPDGIDGGPQMASEAMNSRPSQQRCLMRQLRLGFGQHLHS
jgi:hypothetical protein